MACVENIPPDNVDSEMEEGEIVDDLDDLSDISSEEEFLLRQRLQVLENYNNVLERTKAKRSFPGPGKRRNDVLHNDLSEISATDFDDLPNITSKENVIVYRRRQGDKRPLKSQKKTKNVAPHTNLLNNKEHKKKLHRKKRLELKVISESTDDSDDEYRNKRRKLANAVIVNKGKHDMSSLQARLQKMISGSKTSEVVPDDGEVQVVETDDKQTETDDQPLLKNVSCSPFALQMNTSQNSNAKSHKTTLLESVIEFIDLSTDDDVKIVNNEDTVDAVTKDVAINNKTYERDSDEDLELLRQHALKTKASKNKLEQNVELKTVSTHQSEDEDSDTAELRLICLKSALLKKAIEMKQKQKLKKRLSQSCNLHDDLFNDQNGFLNKNELDNNNTDIESVDMDMESDADDKAKDLTNECFKRPDSGVVTSVERKNSVDDIPKTNLSKEEDFDEDEDLLRARLLTSLSKNLPNLVDPKVIKSIDEPEHTVDSVQKTKNKNNDVSKEKRFIIHLGESDSEGEHPATKNLTKMHMKLSEQVDFQQKLDSFLKSTRMEVEKKKLPDVVQKPEALQPPQKFVAKVVNHLPKSEQIEYKNLVKRMAELEKVKQARQSPLALVNKAAMKPRNTYFEPSKPNDVNNLEEHIAISRKKIAEESSNMLKLKEEAIKLTQKYKIVATELRNLSTAITLNKKEQKTVQNRLTKQRIQHQRLLNSSSSKHSTVNCHLKLKNAPKTLPITKLQKENDPSKDENKVKQPTSLKVTTVNNQNDDSSVINKRLGQIDASNIKVTVEFPKRENDDLNIPKYSSEGNRIELSPSSPSVQKVSDTTCNERKKDFDDYESPLQALGTATWDGDPNAILCPFEVGGHCKDADCKYLHPKIPS